MLVGGEAAEEIQRQELTSLTRGLAGLPFVFTHLLRELRPFVGYIAISCILYCLWLFWSRIRQRGWGVGDHSILQLLLLFLGSVWLLSTTLFFGSIPGLEQRLLSVPLTDKSNGTVFQENAHALQAAGCLLKLPASPRAEEQRFSYRAWCMQKALFTRVFPPFIALVALSVLFLALGKTLLRILRIPEESPLVSSVFGIGMGAATVALLLWLLAFLHILHTFSAWGLLAAIVLLCHREIGRIIRLLRAWRFPLPTNPRNPTFLLLWLLLSIAALNFLTVIRPFPIGWDDLGRYINHPRQIGSFGTIIPGMGAPQWEYVTSLGFLLFGASSTFSAVLAQEINWLSGAFALLAMLAFAQTMLSPRAGLRTALFYYTLPMVGHFAFTDMKTENALFFFGILGMLCIYRYCFAASPEMRGNMRLLFLAGIFFAAGFATKPTIVHLFFAGGIILTFHALGNAAGIGSMLLSTGIFATIGGLSLPAILEKITGFSLPQAHTIGVPLLFISGSLLLAPSVVRRAHDLQRIMSLQAMTALLAGFLVFSAPWLGRNMILNRVFSIGSALTTPNTISPLLVNTPEELPPHAPPGSRSIVAELRTDQRHERCRGSAGREELGRYGGQGSGWMRYFGLPWRAVMNRDIRGYYVILSPLFLILPLLLLSPLFWKKDVAPQRLLFVGTAFMILQWIFTAQGVPWYGIGAFLGLALLGESLLPLAPTRAARVTAGTLVTVSLLLSFSFRMWIFDLQSPMLAYAWGKESAEIRHELLAPHYREISRYVTDLSAHPERPYLYRIGTSINYFVPRNLSIITAHDNQLDTFNCLNQEEDHLLTLRRLQAFGFHSIVFDTNTATIEADPNGSLHQKVQRFLDFANDPAVGVIPVVNAPEDGIAYMLLPSKSP
jgi:hypothetical protein